MSLVEVRQEIVDRLDELDEAMLQAIHTIVFNVPSKSSSTAESKFKEVDSDVNGSTSYEDEHIHGYEPDGTPITTKDLKKIISEGWEDFKNGNYITLDELKKESEQWIKDMK